VYNGKWKFTTEKERKMSKYLKKMYAHAARIKEFLEADHVCPVPSLSGEYLVRWGREYRMVKVSQDL
jgi:hypothetical protein